MCMLLYGEATHELPPTDRSVWEGIDVRLEGWIALSPRLSVSRLSPSTEVIRQHLHEPFVVEFGAYGGCACGLNRLADQEADESHCAAELAEDTAARESRSALANYVALNRVSSLYFCWTGDEQLPSEGETEISIDQLRNPRFALPERTTLRIRTAPPSSPESE